MLAVSYDPDAGTLYWYFTEIIAGSTEAEGECASTLLLDDDGQIVGLELELDETVTDADLALALAYPQVRYDHASFVLTVMLADVADPDAQPLSEPAILDFDAGGQLQGSEIQPAKTFGLGERLERLAPFMVDLDADDELPPVGGDGPEVFTLPTAAGDEAEDDQGQGERPAEAPAAEIRSGFVALVGRPNVGKSTLLNALLGQKVAIVSPKPQTTRMPLRGMLNRPDAQVIFVDTPGIHDPRTKLGSFMVEQARRSIPDADVICMVVDISEPPNRMDRRIAEMVRRARAPHILVLNKVDIRNPKGQEFLSAYRELGPWDMEVAVSAILSKGLDTLVDEIVVRLPKGAMLYPADQTTDQSEREHAAELVREQVLRFTEQEVPHSVAVEVEEWAERDAATYIRMTIYVEKDSQKGIIIGAQGAMLKQIGSAARRTIETSLGRTVFLDLWVKARTNWRDDPSSLHWLGYTDR